MNYFSSLLTAVCAACILIGALYMLCPDGAMKKSVSYILGLVFLLSVISASGITVKKADINITLPKVTSADTTALSTAAAEYVYASALKAAGIEFYEITVCTNKSEDGSISISKVLIRSDCEKGRILEALGEAAKNFEVEVINE